MFDPNKFGINIAQEFQGGFNSSFPGFIDVNTLSTETLNQFIDDIRYLKSLGFKRFRFATPDYSWAARLTYHRTLLTALAQEGNVHIEYGVGSLGNFNAWRTWVDIVDSHIQWFQTLIDTYSSIGVTGKWITGNEEEFASHRGGSTPSTMVRSSNVVTVTMTQNHWLSTGFHINIGSSTLVTSGEYTVLSVPTENSFTIASVGSDGSTSNNGSVSFSVRGTREFIKKMCTHFKTLTGPSITVPLVYCCAQGWEALDLFYNFEPWSGPGAYPYVGKGDLDEVHLNIYSASSSNVETNWLRFKDEVDRAYELFGSDVTISEWNNYEDDTTSRAMNDDLDKRIEYLNKRLDLINSYGMCHYFFAYRMPSKLAEKYPAYNNNGGGIRPSLFNLIGQVSPYVEIIPV